MNVPLTMPDFDPEKAKVITCTIEGILEEADVLALLNGGTPLAAGTNGEAVDIPRPAENPHDLKRLKEKHHSVARLVAAGLTQSMIAHLSGYNEQYLSVLLNNPSMIELVTLYRVQFGKSAEIITERLRTVGTQALERLEEQIPSMDPNELIQTAKLGLDRSGHGPSTTQHNITETHLFDHTELAKLNAEARRGSQPFIVPVEEVRQALPAPKEPEDADD